MKPGFFDSDTQTNNPCLPVPADPVDNGNPSILNVSVNPRKNAGITHRLLNAVENTSDTVFITDREGRIEYVNPAFEVTTGYPANESLGRNPRMLKSGMHDKAYYNDLWSTILAGRVFRSSIVNRKKNGELIYVDQTITPMRDKEGRVTHFVAVVKDMTEYLRAQEQIIEMKLAAQVQQKLYPKASPQLSGFDIAGTVFSAEAMCGDYYDFIEMPDGLLAIAIGDVSGHGFGQALIMAQARAYLRTLTAVHASPDSILAIISRMLADDLEAHLFVTIFLAIIDPSARSLVYASAGHLPVYILDRDGALKTSLESTGTPLGIMPDGVYIPSPRFTLGEGDIIVFLTDGVTECCAHDDRFIEDEDILEVVRNHRFEPAQKIINAIHTKTMEFARGTPPCDDITIVICKVDASADTKDPPRAAG